MEIKLDLSKEYGIVLEGGGAKGSYQIGAWKALREAGIRIRGVAGASVGSLNGALICMDDLEDAEYIWQNIRYSMVMDVNDEWMEKMRQFDFAGLDLREIFHSARRVLKDKGFDVTPLKKLIEETIDEDKIRDSGRDFFITTYSVSDHRLLNLNVKDIPKGEIADMLLASAYFPVFKQEKLNGKRYIDGGGWDNVPMGVLLDAGYEDLIVIRIYGLGFDSEKVTEIPEGCRVYHIAPRQSLGGILEFDKKRAARNMKLGYFDAKRLLYGLEGKWYYLDAPGTETYYFEKMMAEIVFWQEHLDIELPDQEIPLEGCRRYTEQIFPAMAKALGLRQEWNYKELYLACIEVMARELKISRFKIYQVEELLQKIRKKLMSFEKLTCINMHNGI